MNYFNSNKINYQNFTKYLIFILGYYTITAIGFSVLRYFGIDYTSQYLYISSLPMMLFLALYVLFLNTIVLNKYKVGNDFYRFNISKHSVITKLSIVIVVMVICVFIEALWKDKFSIDIIIFTILAFLIGFSEEGMFRGFAISFSKLFNSSKFITIVSSTFFFAILHMVNITNGLSMQDAWNQSIHSIPMGFLAGIIFIYRNTLWPLILWHFSIDYSLFIGRIAEFNSLLFFGYVIDGILIIESIFLVKDIYFDIKNLLNNKKS